MSKQTLQERYRQPQSICTCGHTGDVPFPGGPSQHAGQVGHGACIMKGCACTKFTWQAYMSKADEHKVT